MEKKDKIHDILADIPLFAGADMEFISSAIPQDADIRSFSSGEELDPSGNLVVILEGTARVFSSDEDRSVMLRDLSKGDIFGVAELFGGSCGDIAISRVEAKNKCRALFIPREKMSYLLENDKKIMYNYLDFLCCRIRFLNKRIACFTAGSAERRLAIYLDSLSEGMKTENSSVKVTPMSSMGALALTLDIGRASLYRAIDTLTEDGFIIKDGKSFILSDREKMLKFYNK
ncbi:MAG: Crp/Fnr family transcriptional regulator [Clostridia bacterium]|nr:Crp/Fnr family transcriptional regulator [Clostridia bacterium]MBR6603497.1 Crp/Fnr family transcriptional regulator [Clostridia bacterium]